MDNDIKIFTPESPAAAAGEDLESLAAQTEALRESGNLDRAKRLGREMAAYSAQSPELPALAQSFGLPLTSQREIGAADGHRPGESEYENISAIPRMIEGVRIALTIRETEDGRCKVSARGRVDVSRVCAELGGGGHRAAAGALVRGTVGETRDRLLAIVEEMYGAAFRDSDR